MKKRRSMYILPRLSFAALAVAGLSLVFGSGCEGHDHEHGHDQGHSHEHGHDHDADAEHVAAEAAPAVGASKKLHKHVPKKRLVAPDAREAFDEMVGLIESNYVDGPLSEDELWTAAMEGVMSRLIQRDDHAINQLLSPEDLEHLMEGTKGSIVGVGIMIEHVAGVLTVKGLVPGGPAVDSGLQAGDRVLAVDGQKLKGKSLGDAVYLIRGQEGTTVELFVQRETEEWTVPVTRSVVKVSSVESKMLDETAAYLRINGFSESTVADLDKHLAKLTEAGMKGLVLDLRTNPGGLMAPALATADRFLPKGTRLLTVKGPKGEEHTDASESHAFEDLPLVVITSTKTASGAEILAAALDEHQRATIVGETTFGKGTVEAIHDLENGWALKLSSSRFYSPQGEPRQDNGVVPDIPVGTPEEVFGMDLAQVGAEKDGPLRAAVELLVRN